LSLRRAIEGVESPWFSGRIAVIVEGAAIEPGEPNSSGKESRDESL